MLSDEANGSAMVLSRSANGLAESVDQVKEDSRAPSRLAVLPVAFLLRDDGAPVEAWWGAEGSSAAERAPSCGSLSLLSEEEHFRELSLKHHPPAL